MISFCVLGQLSVSGGSPNDVHERDAKGHGGELVSLLLDLCFKGILVALHKGLNTPLQDLLKYLHPFLRQTCTPSEHCICFHKRHL